jgi:hypothetical protein
MRVDVEMDEMGHDIWAQGVRRKAQGIRLLFRI